MGGVAGHAGLFSNVHDLAKFLKMLLNKGSFNGKQIIKPETVELFTKKQSDLSSRALDGIRNLLIGYSSAGKFLVLYLTGILAIPELLCGLTRQEIYL